jgi:hypothetical protein
MKVSRIADVCSVILLKTKTIFVFDMKYLHVLRGSGNNCTCLDCVVLYGGVCDTTKDNDFLDELENKVIKYISFTPTGRIRKISDSYMDSCINDVIRPIVKKYAKIHENQYLRKYYLFMPLIFLMTSDRKAAELWYRRSRNWVFTDIIKQMKESSKKPIEYD